MLGRAEEAAGVFQEAIESSRGVSPGTFSKSYASLHKFTPEHVADMEAALRYLQLEQGKPLFSLRSPWSPTCGGRLFSLNV